MVRGTDSGRPPLGLVRIEASSYTDALKQITERFGNDVSIVSTRQIRRKGLSGALGATGVEVYVTNPDDHSAYLKSKVRKLDRRRRDAEPRPTTVADDGPGPDADAPGDARELASMVEAMRAQIDELLANQAGPGEVPQPSSPAPEGPGPGGPEAGGPEAGGAEAGGAEPPLRNATPDAPVVRAARRLLETRDFSTTMIGHFIERLRTRRLDHIDGDREELGTIARLHLGELVRTKIPPCVPIKCPTDAGPAVVALIGPTGVGKTTTIAKLASHFRLSQGRKVGLLTLDTYRIGAIDQLRRFAEIMDLELNVVEQGGRTADALAAYKDHDLVFIDTAGRSQRDARRLAEVREMLQGIGSLEVHLCTALGTSRATLLDIAKKFQEMIPYDKLLITKIDESAAHGVLLDLFHLIRKPLSYITCGQEVPNDIESASTERLERLLLGD